MGNTFASTIALFALAYSTYAMFQIMGLKERIKSLESHRTQTQDSE